MATGFPPSILAYDAGAWQLGEFIGGPLEHVLQYLGVIHDSTATDQNLWMQAALEFKFSASINNADNWFTTFDVAKYTSGTVDANWTATDHTNLDIALAAFATTYLTLANNRVQVVGDKHYTRAFTPPPTYPLPPDYKDKPFVKSGPPVFVNSLGGAGSLSSSNCLPPQNAVSVTRKTAYPMHWGRNYLPQLDITMYGGNGTILSPACDTLAAAADTLVKALISHGLLMVVPSTQSNNIFQRALLTVTAMQVDNNPDVIRRRRIKSTSYRAHHP